MIHRQHALHHAGQQRLAARRFLGQLAQHAAKLLRHPAQRAGHRSEFVVRLARERAGILRVHQFPGERLDAPDAPAEGARNEKRHHQREACRHQRGLQNQPTDGSHRHVDLPQRHGQPQNDAGHALRFRGHRQVAQVDVHSGATAHRRSTRAGQRLPDFGPPGVVLHGGRIVLRIGDHRAIAGDDGHARASFDAGAGGPRIERWPVDGGQRRQKNPRLRGHGVLGVL